MEVSDVGWSKVLNKGRKRVTADATPMSAKARTKANATPSSSLGEVPDLQARKVPRTAVGRTRSMSPKKQTPSANRIPLGERSHNWETRHTPTSQLKQVASGQNENDENSVQTQIPSTLPEEL